MKVVIYARHSDRPDAAEAQSTEVQIARCREEASRRYPESGVIVYADRGISGADEDRDGLWSAVNALEKGDVLLVTKWDRLARDVGIACMIEKAVASKKAEIVTIDEALTDTAEGKLMRRMLQSFSEYEREMIAGRTRIAMRRMLAEGRYIGGQPPFGMRREGDRLVPDEREAEAAKEMRKWRRYGKSLNEISRILFEKGFASRTGKPYTRCTIKRVLDETR